MKKVECSKCVDLTDAVCFHCGGSGWCDCAECVEADLDAVLGKVANDVGAILTKN